MRTEESGQPLPVSLSGETPDRSAGIFALQTEVLAATALARPLKEILHLLCQRVELMTGDVHCSILIREADRLRSGAAPSLPDDFTRKIDGVLIGPAVGSCGTAAFRAAPVEVSDIENDPLWAPYKKLPLRFGLKACWSFPILARDGGVLGTFALYFDRVRGPDAFHHEAVRASTYLAAIAIERAHMDDEAARYRAALEERNRAIEALNESLESRVEARTAELAEANEELLATIESLNAARQILVESEKLASLGRLVAGVAHELNTPLGNALTTVTTLDDEYRWIVDRIGSGSLKRSELMGFLDKNQEGHRILARNIARAADIIVDFKQLAIDQTSMMRRSFPLDEVVREVLTSVQPSFKGKPYRLETIITVDRMIDGYPGPLGQVITNIVTNALVHAFGGRDAGTIRIAAAPIDDTAFLFEFADDGVGMAEEIRRRIFEPFFTTKLGQGGSGLGMHIVHTIISGMLGGTIEVFSQPGSGTTFRLRLPFVAPLLDAGSPRAG